MLVTLSLQDTILTIDCAGERASRPFSARDREQLDAVARAFDDAHTIGSERVLPQCGRALSQWLDGDGGWLAKLLPTPASDVSLHVDDRGDHSGAMSGLLAAPWELLSAQDTYLANDERRCFSVVRRVGRATPPRPPTSGPLSVLFAAPSPGDLAQLDFEAEHAAISEATEGLAISLRFDESGTLRDFGEAVRRAHQDRPFDVLHIACHATARPRPCLMFEDVVGLAAGVEPQAFVAALGDAVTGFGLLTLSSCMTAVAPRGHEAPPLALALVLAGVSAVLGWASNVDDAAATRFSAAFYRHLASQPASLERAVAVARFALLRDPRRYRGSWSMPRLYAGRRVDEPLCVPGDERAVQRLEPAPGAAPLLGRRREVHRLLAALREGGRGIVVHGLGGVGKTALVRAALERLGGAEGSGTVDLRCGREAIESEILNISRALPRVMVLDGFEAVLEPVPGELHRIKAGAQSWLAEFVGRVRADPVAVLVVVSRVDFRGLGHHEGQGLPWLRLSLGPLEAPAVEKWLRRLRIPFGIADPFMFLRRCATVAAEQPALLRWVLNAAIQNPEGWMGQLDLIEAGDYSPLAPMLAELEIPAVATQLTATELSLLLDVLTFDAPLPYHCLVTLCHHLGVAPAAIGRLCALGAWSELPDPLDPDRPTYVRAQIVVDWLLANGHAAPDDERARVVAAGALQSLRHYWAGLECGLHLERYRMAYQLAELALLVGDASVAAEVAASAVLWARQHRSSEDALRLSVELLALLGPRRAADPCRFLFVCVELHEHGATAEQRETLFAEIETVLRDIAIDEHENAPGLLYELAHHLHGQDAHARALELLAQAHAELQRRDERRECAIVQSKAFAITAELGDLAAAREGFERDVIPVFQELGDIRDLAGALRDLAGIALNQGLLDEAWDLAAQARTAHENLGAWDGWAAAVRIQVDVLMARGQAEDALRLCRERVLPVCEALKDDEWMFDTGWALLHVLRDVGALVEAEDFLANRLIPAVQRRDRISDQIAVWIHLADIVEERGQIARCVEILTGEVRPRYEKLADLVGVARVDIRHARLLVRIGKVERATEICAESLDRVEADDKAGLAELHGVLALIATGRGDLEQALEIHLTQEVPRYEQIEDKMSVAMAYGHVADVLDALGRYEAALEVRLTHELPVYVEAGETRSHAIALGAVAWTRVRLGQLEEAERILRDNVLPVLSGLGEVREVAVAYSWLADVMSARGQHGAARLLVEQQVPIFERLADRTQLARAKRRIARALLAVGDLVGSLKVRENEELPIWEDLDNRREASVTRAIAVGTRAAMAAEAEEPAARAAFAEALRELGHFSLRPSDELWPELMRLGVREEAIAAHLAGRCKLEVLAAENLIGTCQRL